jgi:integrase
VAKLPGLFQRGSTFYLRVIVPKDLRPLYQGQGKLIRTLGTSAADAAKLLGTQQRAQALLTFARQRGAPSPNTAHAWSPKADSAHTHVGASITLRDVHARWTASKSRTADSVNACLRAVDLFEKYTRVTLPLHAIDRQTGDGFRAWLIQPARGTTPKTARDRLTWLKSLLKYAAQDLELLPRNPWQGLDIAAKTAMKRRPWADDELHQFFHRPLFNSYTLPTDSKAGAEAAYWIPLLAIFSGARVGELAQLRPEDVAISDVPHIAITDEGNNQRVKSAAGVRQVPIHSELIRLGFLEFAHARQSSRSSSLWPSLPQREGKPGGFFSQWFGEERRAAGIDGAYPDFHCFRHTVRTQLAEVGIPEPHIDAIMGHEAKGSTGNKVYTHRSMHALRTAIEAISYPSLRLPQVSV